MKHTLILSAILVLCLGACEYQSYDVEPNPETGAPDTYFGHPLACANVVCTANFADISVTVVDGAGAAVGLDSFVVTSANGTPVTDSATGKPLWGNPHNGDGRYTILNDAWVAGHQGLGAYFHAKGFRNGTRVFDEMYKISADCCHVSKISGKDRIIVP